jgi:flagellar basal body rod protein FlgC
VVIDKSLLDGVEEEIVESCVDNEDDDFRNSVPILVDFHEATMSARTTSGEMSRLQRDRRRYKMSWDPDDEHGNVDHRAWFSQR